jgi:hypothetical protein
MEQRHSVRNFTNKPVPHDSILNAVTLANTLPSACNRQPCSLIIIKNDHIKNKLLDIHCGNKGFSAPVLGVVVANLQAFTQEYEQHAPYYHGGLFSAGLILGLESEGLSSCLLNWHVNSEDNLLANHLLSIKNQTITNLIFIGYANELKLEAYSYKQSANLKIEIIE